MPSYSLWKSISNKNMLVFQSRERFHRKNDDFTVVAKLIKIFKITWLGFQMEAILVQKRFDVDTESTELWRMPCPTDFKLL